MGIPDAGPMDRLTSTGDNLPNVIQYLSESHPERLAEILATLSRRVPRLEQVTAEPMQDGRLLRGSRMRRSRSRSSPASLRTGR